jgi:hypothetical protein
MAYGRGETKATPLAVFGRDLQKRSGRFLWLRGVALIGLHVSWFDIYCLKWLNIKFLCRYFSFVSFTRSKHASIERIRPYSHVQRRMNCATVIAVIALDDVTNNEVILSNLLYSPPDKSIYFQDHILHRLKFQPIGPKANHAVELMVMLSTSQSVAANAVIIASENVFIACLIIREVDRFQAFRQKTPIRYR